MNSSLIVAFFVFVCLLGLACSWGSDGHQIVGQVGNAFVTSTTQSQINKMLPNGLTLAGIATWPDNYDHTSQGSWSERLHFVNLPNDALNFTYAVCFPPEQSPPGCVVAAVSNVTAHLEVFLEQDYWQTCSDEDDTQAPCQLSFLVHFLGDMHQPLHVAYESDKGGNDFDVNFFNDCTNLHSVWDSGLIEHYESDNNVSWEDMANEIISFLKSNPDVAQSYLDTVRVDYWGDETFRVARTVPYNFSPGTVPPNEKWVVNTTHNRVISTRSGSCDSSPVIGQNYYQRTMPIVFDQLARAGYRLSYQLNKIYDPSYNQTLF